MWLVVWLTVWLTVWLCLGLFLVSRPVWPGPGSGSTSQGRRRPEFSETAGAPGAPELQESRGPNDCTENDRLLDCELGWADCPACLLTAWLAAWLTVWLTVKLLLELVLVVRSVWPGPGSGATSQGRRRPGNSGTAGVPRAPKLQESRGRDTCPGSGRLLLLGPVWPGPGSSLPERLLKTELVLVLVLVLVLALADPVGEG